MSDRSANSSKEKKSKSSTNLQTSSSATFSQSVTDEAELERQYQVYKKQFDEWTAKNKGVVSPDAYNRYVQQFRNWEKEVEERRKLFRLRNGSSGQVPAAANPLAAVANSSAGVTAYGQNPDFFNMANMDPSASMMMMAMMMMPFMMMTPPVAPPPVAAAPAAAPATASSEPVKSEPSSTISFSGAPVSYERKVEKAAPSSSSATSAAPLPSFIPIPDFSKPPPLAASATIPPAGQQRRVEYDRSRREQRFNDRYFDRTIEEPRSYNERSNFYDRGTHEEYNDYWYRRFRERKLAEAAEYYERPPQMAPPFVEPFLPPGPLAPPSEHIFRGANFEPLHRGPEPWTQSGFGANDFSMRKHERHRQL